MGVRKYRTGTHISVVVVCVQPWNEEKQQIHQHHSYRRCDEKWAYAPVELEWYDTEPLLSPSCFHLGLVCCMLLRTNEEMAFFHGKNAISLSCEREGNPDCFLDFLCTLVQQIWISADLELKSFAIIVWLLGLYWNCKDELLHHAVDQT